MSTPEDLCETLRRVIRAARSTIAPAEVLKRANGLALELAELLEPHEHPGPHHQGGLGERGPDPIPPRVDRPASIFAYSPVIGPRNPISPPVEMRVTEGGVQAETVFAPQYCGPPGSVHGGVIALVLDELLGYANLVAQSGGYTAVLTIRYRALTPIERPIRMQARQERADGRKLFTRGSLHHGDTLTAEAEGLFIRPHGLRG
jgi:acyl-coenzyme A thioesterase PaaI-like protein